MPASAGPSASGAPRRRLDRSPEGTVLAAPAMMKQSNLRAGLAAYALRSLQPRTTVRVRTVYDDCRRFYTHVLCYSNAAGGHRCEVRPLGERAHSSDGFEASTAAYAVVLDLPPTR